MSNKVKSGESISVLSLISSNSSAEIHSPTQLEVDPETLKLLGSEPVFGVDVHQALADGLNTSLWV